jgi:predicted DNA-binding transcriptional regulator AlpA
MGANITISRKPVGRVALSPGATIRKCGHTYIGTLDRWLKAGVVIIPGEPPERFPQPDMIVGRIRYWFDSTIDEFQSRCAARLAEWRARQSHNSNSEIPSGEPGREARRPHADNAAASPGSEPGASPVQERQADVVSADSYEARER